MVSFAVKPMRKRPIKIGSRIAILGVVVSGFRRKASRDMHMLAEALHTADMMSEASGKERLRITRMLGTGLNGSKACRRGRNRIAC